MTKTSYRSVRTVETVDLLGAKAAGVRKFDDYYAEEEEPSEDEEAAPRP